MNNVIFISIFLILVLNIHYVTPSKTLYTKTSNISTGIIVDYTQINSFRESFLIRKLELCLEDN